MFIASCLVSYYFTTSFKFSSSNYINYITQNFKWIMQNTLSLYNHKSGNDRKNRKVLSSDLNIETIRVSDRVKASAAATAVVCLLAAPRVAVTRAVVRCSAIVAISCYFRDCKLCRSRIWLVSADLYFFGLWFNSRRFVYRLVVHECLDRPGRT